MALKNPLLGSYHNCIFVPQLLAICISISFYCILASHLRGIIQQFLLFLLWPHFGQIIKLSLSFITFRVSRFPVSHLTYETVKLGLQNTLNMSKTTRVYFGVLHPYQVEEENYLNEQRSYQFKPNPNLPTHYTPALRGHENFSYGGGASQGPRQGQGFQ